MYAGPFRVLERGVKVFWIKVGESEERRQCQLTAI
jgi:hypothetical protein